MAEARSKDALVVGHARFGVIVIAGLGVVGLTVVAVVGSVVGDEVSLGVVEIVGPGLAGVEVGWWDPFGAAVFAYSSCSAAFFDEAVVRPAGQDFFVDVGLSAVGPAFLAVVGLAAISRDGAAGEGAAAVAGMTV